MLFMEILSAAKMPKHFLRVERIRRGSCITISDQRLYDIKKTLLAIHTDGVVDKACELKPAGVEFMELGVTETFTVFGYTS